MLLKAVIEGSLLADCQRYGQIRFGMFRVAEEITKRLIEDHELRLYITNTRQTFEEDQLLRTYISGLPTGRKPDILSHPFSESKKSIVRKLSNRALKFLYPGSVPLINNLDLFHSFYHPFSTNIINSQIAKCITLLDIIPLRMSGYDELVSKTKSIVECIVPNFAISISNFSKEDICDYDKRIDPTRIFVVPLAASERLFYVNKDVDAFTRVKTKYGLPDNYFLSISGNDKRKNLAHLLYSFNQLVLQENIGDLHLVMTGNVSFENTVFKRLDIDQKTKRRIVFPRAIADEDLSVVYSNALCFFFMSTYEGFGLPALEAMQCGTPVVTSNTTSLPEVVGSAGIMLPGNDEDALSGAMLKIYSDEQLRSRLSYLGLQRAAEFSWDRCAQEYSAIFRRIGK